MITKAGALVILCIGACCIGIADVSASQDAARIKQTTQDILSQPIYNLDPTSAYRLNTDWLFDGLRDLNRWINDLLDGLPGPVANAVIIALIVILVALIVHIGYSVYVGFRIPDAVSITVESLPPQNAAELVAQAKALAAAGNYVDASRTLYKAALMMLEQKRGGRLRVGLTNTEYLRTFRTPWVVEQLRVFVDLINWKWYRDFSFDNQDYARCEQAFSAIETGLASMNSG